MERGEAGSAAGRGAALAEFDALFEAHYSEVLAFARRRLDDSSLADDVVAETFAVAWRRRETIPDPARPWLYGVARKVIANQHRAGRRRRSLRERLEQREGPAGPDPAEVYREREAVSNAFAALSGGQREVLMLLAWEGLQPHEAAHALGISYAAFRVRLHRARRAFEQHLTGDPAPLRSPPGSKQLSPTVTPNTPIKPPLTGTTKERRDAQATEV